MMGTSSPQWEENLNFKYRIKVTDGEHGDNEDGN